MVKKDKPIYVPWSKYRIWIVVMVASIGILVAIKDPYQVDPC